MRSCSVAAGGRNLLATGAGRLRIYKLEFVFLLALLLLPGFGHAQAQPDALPADPAVGEFLAVINRNIVALAGKNEAQSERICAQIMASALNVDAVTISAAGRAWDRMSPQQRKTYRGAIEQRLVRDCVSRNRNNRGVPLAFVGLRTGEGGDRLLATRSGTDTESHIVIWRLRGGAQKLRAIDILSDGRSAAISFRDETNALLDRHSDDIDSMIQAFGP